MHEVATPTQTLAALLLGRDLGEYVAEKRQARPKWSWELIAEQIAVDTLGKVQVSRESLRRWYDEDAA